MDSLTRDTARSYLWNQLAVTFDGLTIVVSSVIVGQTLGVSGLGLFGWVMSACGLVTLAAGLGLKEAVTILVQRIGDNDARIAGLFRSSLLVRLVSAAGAAGVTLAALLLLCGMRPLVSFLVGSYVALVLVSGLLSSFNIALFQTATVAAGKLASALVTIGFVAAGGFLGSTTTVFVGLAAGALAGSVVFAIPLMRLTAGPSAPPLRGEFLSLSFSLWLIGLFNYVLGAQAIPFILKLAKTDTVSIGMFTAALTVAATANRAFMGGFATVTLAAFSRAWVAGGPGALQKMYSLYVRVTAMAGVPILLGAIVFAPLLARLSVKEGGPDVSSVIVLLCATFLVGRIAGGGAQATALYAAGLSSKDMAIRAVLSVISPVAVYWAASSGVAAVTVAAGACSVAAIVAEYVVVWRRTRVAMPWPPLVKITATCGAVALASLVVYVQGGFLATAFAALIFAAGTLGALMLARPLASGEAAEIGLQGIPAAFMARFESTNANVG